MTNNMTDQVNPAVEKVLSVFPSAEDLSIMGNWKSWKSWVTEKQINLLKQHIPDKAWETILIGIMDESFVEWRNSTLISMTKRDVNKMLKENNYICQDADGKKYSLNFTELVALCIVMYAFNYHPDCLGEAQVEAYYELQESDDRFFHLLD
jgi:hypothetical protein